jgi:hypothetical protein
LCGTNTCTFGSKKKEHYMMKPLDVIAENTVGFFINK